MLLNVLTGFLLKPVFGAVAVASFALGSFFISEQSTGPLADYIDLSGQEAVLFGIALLSAGAACIIFYLATWFFTFPLVIIGGLLVVSAFVMPSAESFVPEAVLRGYIIEPISGLVNTYAKPIIDGTVKPMLEILNTLQS